MIKYILWDFDGTLVKTEMIAFEIANKLAKKYNFNEIEEKHISDYKLLSGFEFLRKVNIPWYNIPAALKEGQRLAHEKIVGAPLVRGIPQILENLSRNYDQGILSSNRGETIEACLTTNNAQGYFKDIIPDPSLLGKGLRIKRFMHQKGLKRDELIYVGDEIRDIHAAKFVGVHIIPVDWGYSSREGLERHFPQGIIASNPSQIEEYIGLHRRSQERTSS